MENRKLNKEKILSQQQIFHFEYLSSNVFSKSWLYD